MNVTTKRLLKRHWAGAASTPPDNLQHTRTIVSEAPVSARTLDGTSRVLTAIELMLFFACVLLDIWRWQYTRPHLWIALLAAMFLTHLIHRDNWRSLGITRADLRGSAAAVFPVMLVLCAPLLVFGFWSGRLELLRPNRSALLYFAGYGIWCVCQQYLTQSYFHNRLLAVIRNRHLTSALVALMFGAAHLPNPVLTAATAIAGFVFSEVFARHRNIWPLALAQTVGGILIATVIPASIIHNMRVGPGYWFWGIR
jgi:hypothetical protein